MRWAVIALLSACWSGRAPKIEQAEPVANDALSELDRYAIVEVTPRFVECEGAKHFVLETRDKPVRHVRAGRDVKVGEVFVAQVLRDEGIDCFSDFDATALNLVRAYDIHDARSLLEKIRRTGMAKTITIRDHDGHEKIGIGRVIALRGHEVRIEPVHGDVPAQIALPFFENAVLQVGDPIVVASAHAEPTRVLVIRSLDAARKWVDAIEQDGWPRDVIELSADR